ncbi:hypothetical protein PN836_019060 [Ningiella sp. W23]|uniref:hypothetical protein n=1 Tax=Ningiella sp. W23 TaxID=3023715 RepID=UPI0037567DEE
MKYTSTLKTLLACSIAVFSINVFSAALSDGIIDKYVSSINQIKSSDNPNVQSIEGSLMNNGMSFDVDSDGKIALASQMLAGLESAQVDALEDVVEDAGFDDLDEWIDISNRVSAAMLAIEMENEPMDMSELTPEMMQMMPQTMRDQLEGTLRMLEAAKDVPQADIDVVKANMSKLDSL